VGPSLQHIDNLKYSWLAKRNTVEKKKNLPRAKMMIDTIWAQFLPFFFIGAAAWREAPSSMSWVTQAVKLS
jgi:hypothetical protein